MEPANVIYIAFAFIFIANFDDLKVGKCHFSLTGYKRLN
jgi:hypothetical protein